MTYFWFIPNLRQNTSLMKTSQLRVSLLSAAYVVSLIFLFSCKGQEKSESNEGSEANVPEVMQDIQWTHSHEEDQDNGETMYFRHAPFEFPVSRGRIAFTLKSSGEVQYWNIGPTDIPEEMGGTWTIKDGKLFLSINSSTNMKGFEQTYEIVKAEKDLLILKR